MVSTAIREATEADCPGCWRYRPARASTTARCCRSTTPWPLREVQDVPGDYHVYVAVDDAGEIVGTFAMAIMDNLGHLGAPSEHWSKTPRPPAGARIGKQMMRFGDGAGPQPAATSSPSSNLKRDAAHAFYDSLGFQRHGYSFLVLLDDDEEHPADEEGDERVCDRQRDGHPASIVLDGGAVLVRDGLIAEVAPTTAALRERPIHQIDAAGAYLLPAIVELHNDGYEYELNPDLMPTSQRRWRSRPSSGGWSRPASPPSSTRSPS